MALPSLITPTSIPFSSPISCSYKTIPKPYLNHPSPFLSCARSLSPQPISIAAHRLVSSPSPLLRNRQAFVVHAAWTRRSKGDQTKKPNRKSWKQRTDMYMRPFMLNVFFSKRFIHAKVVHRSTSKVISVASTNAKDLRNTLPSLTDDDACRTVGQLIAERSKDADVFAITFEPKKNERIEGRLFLLLNTIKQNGIIFV
ncbi:50S ribosomal protein L18 [Rhynchospora pubera]|uniref:50S ribosomal protein L18 n=1 Tax=Rhynchospora pubera TaxID=906938 RepID=A0AAV8CTQ2_9POAL|nr:50S ribosomal protein L18 [Rhynchospora pubera]